MTIPDRLKSRPVYQGFPVPFTTFMRDGVPDFKVTDINAWFECVQRHLCALCGEPLEYWAWHIGGPDQLETRVYFDLAMHEECARYAAAVCPFIVCGKEYASHVKRPEGGMLFELSKKEHVKNPDRMYLTKVRRDSQKIHVIEGRNLVKVGAAVQVEEIERMKR